MCKHQLGDSSSSLASISDMSNPPLTSAIKSSSSSSFIKKTVRFQSVEIAQYHMQLGDNPSADGLPLCLAWESDFKLVYELEEYETSKPAPRHRNQFWMPPKYREEVLMRLGVTGSEMLRTSTEMKKIQKSRSRSIKNQKWDKLHLMMEESKQTLKRITSMNTLKKVASSLSLDDDQLQDSLSSSTNSKKRSFARPRSMSLSLLTSKFGDKDDISRHSIDPLDESAKSRIAIHLLKNPADLMADGEESPTEELSSDLIMDHHHHHHHPITIQVVEDGDNDDDDYFLYDPSIEF